MIKHIVMWTLKDEFNGQRKDEIAKSIKSQLLDLRNKIPQIKYIEVGINEINPDQNYDVVLVSEFESFDDLEIYSKHPDHMKVVEFLKDRRIERVATDYTM